MRQRALLLCATALVAACGKMDSVRGTASGTPAPAFTAMDLDGKPVALASLHGKVAVLNVWATWCEPCRDEIPQLQALHEQFAKDDVELVGVSVDAAGMGADVRDFMKDHGMTYTVWLDPQKEFALKFLTVGVPETFIVDKTGVIRWHRIGALAHGDTTLASAIRQALNS